jgi:hypothetical protein
MVRLVSTRVFWFCLLPYAWVVGNAWRTFSGLSLVYISAGIAINSLVLACICGLTTWSLCRRASPAGIKQSLPAVVGALCVTFSFAYSFLVFMQWSQVTKLACLPLVAVAALLGLTFDRVSRAIQTALLLAITLAFVQSSMQRRAAPPPRSAIATPAPAPGAKPPNIYLLMFDAMSEADYYSATFGRAPPWQVVLAQEGFRESANARSSRPYSMQSIVDVLQERQMPWSAFGDSPIEESASLTIDSQSTGIDKAHAAGYKVAFLYQNNYFGTLHPLQHLDAYEPQRSIGFCSLAPIRVGLHLCRGTQELAQRLTGQEDEVTAHHRVTSDFIRKTASHSSAWILWSYIALPEHTSLTYRDYADADKAEFIDTHLRNSQRATMMMQDYLATIKALDPNAIVVIFGDHGILRSRGWRADPKAEALFPATLKEVDERGIGLFVKPGSFCADRIGNAYQLEKLLTDLMACVAVTKTEAAAASTSTLTR